MLLGDWCHVILPGRKKKNLDSEGWRHALALLACQCRIGVGRVIFSPNNILDVFPLRGCLSSRLCLENKFLQPAAIRSDGLTTEALDLALGADMERVREFKGGRISWI